MEAPPPEDPAVPGLPVAPPPPASNPGGPGVPRWLVAAGVGGVAVVAVATAAVALLLLKPAQAIDRMVPASADGYAAAYVDPSVTQKLNLLSLTHRFPGLKTDADITSAVDRYLDKVFANSGLAFSTDVRPWLGSQMDFIVRGQGDGQDQKAAAVAFLVASKDDARARAALVKLRGGPLGKPMAWSDETYRGVAISAGKPTGVSVQQAIAYAFVHHTVILASSEPLIKEVIDADAGQTPRLIDSANFRAALGRVPADKLVFAYANGQAAARSLTKQLSASPRNPLGADGVKFDQLAAAQTIAFALVAKPNGLLADLEVKVDPSRLDAATRSALSASGNAAAMTGWIPKPAYGFAATATLKSSLTALVETFKSDQQTAHQLQEYGITGPDGVLAHLTGEAALEVEPGQTRYPAASVLIGTTDKAGMERFLQRLTEAIAPLSQGLTQGITVKHTTYHGAVITTLVAGELSAEGYAPSYTVTQGFAIIGSSVAEVEAVITAHETGVTIASAEHYKAAAAQAVSNPSGLFYADVGAIAAAARPLLSPAEQGNYDLKVAPYLGPLTAVITTSQGTSTSLSQLYFLLITGVATALAGGTQT